MTGEDPRAKLAALLRTTRLDAAFSGEQLAQSLGWSQSKVSKIENGRTRPSREDVTNWLDAVRAPQELHTEAVALTEAALVEARHWRVAHKRGLTTRQREVGRLEDRAQMVRSFQPGVIPGLLQTAEYARHVLKRADITGQSDVAAAVAARLERQRVLYRGDIDFRFVLTEAVLRWRPDDGRALAAQLDRLLSLSTLSNVDLAVLAFDSVTTLPGAHGFLLYEIPDDPVVLVETHTRELVIHDPDEVAAYRDLHAGLHDQALTGDAARDLIRDLWSRLVH